MPEQDFWNPDLEAFWGEACDVLVRFHGKTWDEAIAEVKQIRKDFGCDEPGYDPMKSMLFHELPCYWLEGRYGECPEATEYYTKKYFGE